MNKQINVLIVEDEPLIINSLQNVLEHISDSDSGFTFKISTAKNCDTADYEIEKAINGIPLDLILLDISIPASKDRALLSGEDLGVKIRDLFPKAKIMVFTSHNNNYRLNNILKTINPDGFLIKSDIDFMDLVNATTIVLNGDPYYSNAILRLMRLHVANEFTLDGTNRKILYLLSKGIKNKDLPGLINLSKGGIERRKRVLKEIFSVENKDDSALISEAAKRGYI
ncbi:response regulator [Pontimicrobium aquaticum]|nr:response regulator [Pontimicrobium aquaticum]